MKKYGMSVNTNENSSHMRILHQIEPGSTVLECGCASGYMTRYMRDMLEAHVSVIEHDSASFETAREYAEDGICADLNGEEWVQYFAGRQFDYILFADVLEHLTEPLTVLRNAAKLLSEDGEILCSVPNIAHHDVLMNLSVNRMNYMPLGLLDDTHIHFWGKENLAPFFEAADLFVVEFDYCIIPPYQTEQRVYADAKNNRALAIAMCDRPYADVYQFIVTAMHRRTARCCIDRYEERHYQFGVEPPVVTEYKREMAAEAQGREEQTRILQQETERILILEKQISDRDMSIESITRENDRCRQEKQLAEEQRLISEGEQRLLQRQYDILTREENRMQEELRQLRELLARAKNENAVELAKLEEANAALRQRDESIAYLQLDRDELMQIRGSRAWKLMRGILDVLDRLRGRSTVPPVVPVQPVSAAPAPTVTEEESTEFFHVGDPIGILCTKHTAFIAKLIRNALDRISVPSFIEDHEPEKYDHNRMYIVICPQMFKKMPGRYIAFQMEQTVSSRWLTEDYFHSLSHAYAALDYSLVNIAYFKKNFDFGKNFYYLPIDYLPGQRREEKDYVYDVVFYGDPNCPRRKSLLDELSRHFSVKVISEMFGEELYSILAQARIVVNVHYYENAMLETTRIYETLSLGRSLVVSERSTDPEEEKRLENIVEFTDINDVDAMVERVGYWLEHEAERLERVAENNRVLSVRENAFDFFFYRFLLAQDFLSFDRFYDLAGNYVRFEGDRICLSLPEAAERRAGFDADNHFGFQVIPGLRHQRGWTGCGLSYKFIMRKAAEAELEQITVCEDDVFFPDNFEQRWLKSIEYLSGLEKWDVFQGLMADVGKVTVSAVEHQEEQTFVHLDHMISMVFNVYNRNVYAAFAAWDETKDDVQSNTIDRALEARDLTVIAAAPFLVGHKEDQQSVIWGFNNSQYTELIQKSSEKLMKLVAEFDKENTKEKETVV